MNERIKELAKQADAYAHNILAEIEIGGSYLEYYSEKFADLIIKECIKIALDHDPLWGASVDQDIERLLGVQQ